MANRIPKLTKRTVEALKAGGADAVYWDGELTGFGVRVRKSGRKNYVLQTRSAASCAGSPSDSTAGSPRSKRGPPRSKS